MRKVSILLVLLIMAFAVNASANEVPGATNVYASVTVVNPVTQADVRKAIILACPKRGWMAKEIKPGHMQATINVRSHTAVVDIIYTAKEYEIKYKSSVNLTTRGGTIHRNYNKWVANLRRDIDLEIARVSASK